MMLASLHPGVTVEDVRREIPWQLQIAPELTQTQPPSAEEVRIIRMLDAQEIFTGSGMAGLSFDKYIRMLEQSLEQHENT